jgi:tetratricopeptide (TPR) repeat protein
MWRNEMRGKLLPLLLISIFLSACAVNNVRLVSLSDGTTIFGEYHRTDRFIKITMPDGETLQGTYSSLTNSFIGFGSLLNAATTSMILPTATDGSTEAYALLRGNRGAVMEMVLYYSEWSGNGYGYAKTNTGTGYRVVFPVSRDDVGIDRGKSGKGSSGKESTGIGDPKALEWLGRSYLGFQNSDWAEVIRSASAAIGRDPTLEGAYLNRAWAYYKERSFDQSARDCTAVIGLNPDSVLAYNYRGLSYAEKGLSGPALKDLNKAVQLDGKNAVTLNNRGVVFQRKGDKEEALVDYRTSCESGFKLACKNYKGIAGVYPAIIAKRVNKLIDESNECFQKADWTCTITKTSEALKLDSSSVIAYTNRAGAYVNKRMFNEAAEDCDKAIRIKPDYGLAYNNRGYMYQLVGQRDQAKSDYEMACNLGETRACENLRRMPGTGE